MKLIALVFAIILIATASALKPQYWGQQATELQRQSQLDLPLNKVAWAVSVRAHDYYRGRLYYPPSATVLARPIDVDLHHTVNMTNQLENGFHWLDFELHWIPEIAQASGLDADKLFLCTTDPVIREKCFVSGNARERAMCQVQGIVDYGRDTGCFAEYDRNFEANLREVVDWLSRPDNSDVFIVIDIKWKLNSVEDNEVAAKALLEQTILNIAGSKVFKPSEFNGTWPSIRGLSNAGKQILFVVDNAALNGSGMIFNPATNGNTLQKTNVLIKDFDWENCTLQANGLPVPVGEFAKVIEDRAFNILIEGNLDASVLPLTGAFNTTTTQYTFYCGLSVGLTDASDTRTELAVWSYAPGMPQNLVVRPATEFDECVRVEPYTFRWDSVPCSQTVHVFACQSRADPLVWTVNATAKYGYETPVCPNGFFFSYPTNPVEMKALADALIYDRAQTLDKYVWVNVPEVPAIYPLPPPPMDQIALANASYYIVHPDAISSQPFTTSFPSSSMVPHRFCGLASDASNYDCDWSAYPGDVLSRSIGILVIAGVGLLLFIAAFVYAGAFHTKACADNKGRQDKDEEMGEKKSRKGEKKAVNVKAESNKSKLAWLYLILPIAVMIVGGVLLLMSNGKITSAFVEVEVEFTHRRSAMIEMIDTIKKVVYDIPMGHNLVLTAETQAWLDGKLKFGVDMSTGSVDDFLGGVKFSKLSREYSGYAVIGASALLILLLLVFAFKRMNRSLRTSAVFMAFVMFLTLSFMAYNYSLTVVSNDICHEIPLNNSMFRLWHKFAKIAFYDLEVTVTEPAIKNLTITGCAQLDYLCTLPYQACGNFICHAGNIYTAVEALPIVDLSGKITDIRNCSNSSAGCEENSLQLRSENLMMTIGAIKNFREVHYNISVFNDLFSSPFAETGLGLLFCNKFEEDILMLYIGCGILVIGQACLVAYALYLSHRFYKQSHDN